MAELLQLESNSSEHCERAAGIPEPAGLGNNLGKIEVNAGALGQGTNQNDT